MIDIVDFSGDMFKLGYSKVINVKEFNVAYGSKDNRRLLENKKLDILISPEREINERGLAGLKSGLNHILLGFARKNEVAIGISLREIIKSRNIARKMAMISQNIKLCRKYKVRMMIASFAKNKYEMRDARDVYNLCLVLGMSNREARDAMNFRKKEEMPRFYEG